MGPGFPHGASPWAEGPRDDGLIMEWRDEGFVLSARRHGESALVVELLTREHGRHAGMVRGGQSPRRRAVLQPGNGVAASWRARLPQHLGTMECELIAAHAARSAQTPRRAIP